MLFSLAGEEENSRGGVGSVTGSYRQKQKEVSREQRGTGFAEQGVSAGLMLVSESGGGEWKSAALRGFKTKPAERLKSAESTSLRSHRDRLALKFRRVGRGWFTVNPGGSAVPQAFPARADLAAQSELPPLVPHQRPVPAQVLG